MPDFQSASPLRIGLLGGSFNPAHAGHVHISLEALKRLQLDYVWWLVSPANPLKDPATLAPFEQRYDHAAALTARHPRLAVSDIEQRYRLHYTHQSVQFIRQRFPQHRFVWLMGGDNLAGFHHWEHWERIAERMPIAVLDRAPFTHHALHCPFATRYAHRRVLPQRLAVASVPAWSFLFIRRHPESATRLRKILGKHAFLGHNKR